MIDQEFTKIGKIQTASDVLYDVRTALNSEINGLETGLGNGHEVILKAYKQLGEARDLLAQLAIIGV